MSRIREETHMTVSETAAERLHKLYADELRQSLRPPVHPMVNARQTRAMIRRAREGGPGLYEEPDATTWIWSDLHLGHEDSITAFDRPFPTPDDKDQAMRHAWYELVDVDDTIICLGDVGVDSSIRVDHQAWWRDAPGTKWLVIGNHDLDTEALHDAGFTEQHVAALCATDPPLALSHLPLRRVPPTAVNVHGHLHGGEAPTRRHINVSVERTDYAPVGLTWVLELARRRNA